MKRGSVRTFLLGAAVVALIGLAVAPVEAYPDSPDEPTVEVMRFGVGYWIHGEGLTPLGGVAAEVQFSKWSVAWQGEGHADPLGEATFFWRPPQCLEPGLMTIKMTDLTSGVVVKQQFDFAGTPCGSAPPTPPPGPPLSPPLSRPLSSPVTVPNAQGIVGPGWPALVASLRTPVGNGLMLFSALGLLGASGMAFGRRLRALQGDLRD